MQAKIATPIIIVNFKTYSEAAAERAIDLAKKAEKVGQETGVCIGLAPQVADIYRVAKAVKLPVFAQHVDPITAGNCTGQVLAQSISKAGAIGMLINHSERQLKLSEIDELVDLAKKQKLVSCVCTNNPRVSAAVASLGPDIIAVEPPDLIGTGIAVSKAQPEVVTTTVKLVRKINFESIVLCGAGVSHGEDVSTALKLGMDGVLVASGIVKAKDPYAVLLEFANAAGDSKHKRASLTKIPFANGS